MSLFDTMSETLLAVLGTPSYLNGSPTPVQINIEHGVQMAGLGAEQAAYRGDYVAERDVATVPKAANAKAGDTFVQAGVTYRLESLLKDNGANRRFMIQEVRLP